MVYLFSAVEWQKGDKNEGETRKRQCQNRTCKLCNKIVAYERRGECEHTNRGCTATRSSDQYAGV